LLDDLEQDEPKLPTRPKWQYCLVIAATSTAIGEAVLLVMGLSGLFDGAKRVGFWPDWLWLPVMGSPLAAIGTVWRSFVWGAPIDSDLRRWPRAPFLWGALYGLMFGLSPLLLMVVD
jgi:hypothetical protein